MATTRKKPQPKPGEGDGGVRVSGGAPAPQAGGLQWHNPRETVPTKKKSLDATPLYTRALRALKAAGVEKPTDQLIAAMLIAQALDRHGGRVIEAAAVGRYRG